MSNKGKFLFNLQKKKGKKNSGKRLKKKKYSGTKQKQKTSYCYIFYVQRNKQTKNQNI